MGKIYHPGTASGGQSEKICSVCRGQDDGNYSWTEPYFHGVSPLDNDKSASWIAVPETTTRKTPLLDTQIRNKAVETIRGFGQQQANGEDTKPFFLAVGFHKPHLPWVFPEKYLEYYPVVRLPDNNFAPYDMPTIAWQSYGETRGYADISALNASGSINTSLPHDKIKELRRAYYSSVSYTDDNIGAVLNALDDAGLKESTVVAFWGDHGWQLGEHGEWDKVRLIIFSTPLCLWTSHSFHDVSPPSLPAYKF